MKINIYYGGRGLVNDPSLYVINKMQTVFEELNVKVERYMLSELKNNIISLPKTLKDVDGIVLATTVEWYGIGGYMQQFLDACWLYGDKEKISKIYMCPVVMSTTYGEREGKLTLATAWEILGGRPCSGLCGYIVDGAAMEMNDEYAALIEKKAENIYRTINQKPICFPASNQAVKQMVSVPQNIDLTPQESERLSMYAADDDYVAQQKQDIQDLTNMFRGMMNKEPTSTEKYINELKKHFCPMAGFKGSYNFIIDKLPIGISIKGAEAVYEGKLLDKADGEISMSQETMNEIINGKITFQKAFMSGDTREKGDFKILRSLDDLYRF